MKISDRNIKEWSNDFGNDYIKRNPIKEPTVTRGIKEELSTAAREAIATDIQPATKPSIPSMKLVKLITAVTATRSRKRDKGYNQE